MSFTISRVTVSKVAGVGSGGDYFQQDNGHWLIGSLIANPMSGHAAYKEVRTSWGINVLGSIVVEIETESGARGVATGFGGTPAAWIISRSRSASRTTPGTAQFSSARRYSSNAGASNPARSFSCAQRGSQTAPPTSAAASA